MCVLINLHHPSDPKRPEYRQDADVIFVMITGDVGTLHADRRSHFLDAASMHDVTEQIRRSWQKYRQHHHIAFCLLKALPSGLQEASAAERLSKLFIDMDHYVSQVRWVSAENQKPTLCAWDASEGARACQSTMTVLGDCKRGPNPKTPSQGKNALDSPFSRTHSA